MSEPSESGYYHHTNGHGGEEIVYLDFSLGGFWVHKLRDHNSYPLEQDKGEFGDRIELPSEE